MLLATAPTPLVVGIVRDQSGAPIAGARVAGGGAVTQTDEQGTFALQTGAQNVSITCSYCQTLTRSVTAGQPLVVLIHRFDAMAQEAPSQRDIASVPYGDAESLAALRPFTLLERSSSVLAGAQVSDRGAASNGALVFDDGIPVYDIVSNRSPFDVFPSYTVQQISWSSPAQAFTYGDLGGGGTVLAQTRSADPWSGLAGAGDASAFRTAENGGDAAWSLDASSVPGDVRERADAFAHLARGDDAFDITAVASQGRYSPPLDGLDTSATGMRVS